jgi:hypothetical protein
LIKDLINRLLGKSVTLPQSREEYAKALGAYISRYGSPSGTRTVHWKELEAQRLLGNRTLLYKFFNSKLEALEAARNYNRRK